MPDPVDLDAQQMLRSGRVDGVLPDGNERDIGTSVLLNQGIGVGSRAL